MDALIGCECSGRVRDALRAAGVNAWSCDLKPCETGSRFHIVGDILETLADIRSIPFIGLHPDCTAMTLSGNGTYAKGKSGHPKRIAAVEWTVALWGMAREKAKRAYLENPRGVLWHRIRNVQWIQPHQFGHGETKSTGLALHNLPPLFHSSLVAGREQRVWKMPPGPERKTERSRTYEGIAGAMADQWGRLITDS